MYARNSAVDTKFYKGSKGPQSSKRALPMNFNFVGFTENQKIETVRSTWHVHQSVFSIKLLFYLQKCYGIFVRSIFLMQYRIHDKFENKKGNPITFLERKFFNISSIFHLKYSWISLKRTPLGPRESVPFIEVSSL